MKTMHCRVITRLPQTGQSSLSLKLDAVIQMADIVLMAQSRWSTPWKTYFSDDDSGGSNSDTNSNTDTGGNTDVTDYL